MITDGISRGAIFSRDQRYRYLLTRRWAPGPTVVGVLLNPSRASGAIDDATASTFLAFARLWGFGAFAFVNAFALISTDPAGLIGAADPVGPDNDAHIVAAVEAADRVVCAWGANVPPAHGARIEQVLDLIGPAVPLWCLGTNMDGSPRHPLRLAHSTPLVRFHPVRRAA